MTTDTDTARPRPRTWLRERREQLGLTQAEIGERLGRLGISGELRTQQGVARLERGGVRKLSPDRVTLFAAAYECSTSFILEGEYGGGRNRIQLRGVMTDKDELEPPNGSGDSEWVEAAVPLGRNDPALSAIRITTDRFAPRWKRGELIFLGAEDPRVARHFGREALVRTRDGRVLLKQMHSPPAGASAHSVMLLSLANPQEPPIVAEVEWAAPVRGTMIPL